MEDNQNALTGIDRKIGVSEYDSMLSMFDNSVTEGKRLSNHVFEIGDMVWGKVKSHPWWPGFVYNEAFATNSVRRSKRKGCVLVAFFGDSSYGWFDVEELIPFEVNFAEKSKQITARAFLKAVEEAADEVARRRGLGLACKCRNPYNFRPGNVDGYFAVALGDNEPPAVYSMEQIRKARDEFRPSDVVGFMRGLAVMPKKDRRGDLGFLKERSSVLAYRRAVYEEFDETYAQAFGQSSVQQSVESREALMQSVKAPLSGPLVIAETLGKKKTPTKSSKKDNISRDKYIFKRRDEGSDLRSQEMGHSVTSPIQREADGEYILQRRAPSVSPDQETPGEIVIATPDRPALTDSVVMASDSLVDKVEDLSEGAVLSEGARTSGTGLKKVKKLKRPAGVLGPDTSVSGEKKKTKRKDSGDGMSAVNMQKFGPSGDLGPDTEQKKRKKKKYLGTKISSDGKGVSGGGVSKEATKVDGDLQRKGEGEDKMLANSVGNTEVNLVDLLGDLHALALDPFHGRERNSPAFTRRAFLKFRSLVFQKSLGLSNPSEVERNESPDLKPRKSSDLKSAAVKDQLPLKKAKSVVRPGDQTKGGQKRGPSDRQEEIAAKRQKKVTEIKSLTVDKKALGDKRDSGVARLQKPHKLDSRKKLEAPQREREPTMLVLKFTPQSTLPSGNELKARLARFGQLDLSKLRIFASTYTCRVVFLYKEDAEAAYQHIRENNSMFGSMQVRCYTRPLETPAPQDTEIKMRSNSRQDENATASRAQSTAQIKSCLKKPTLGEAGPASGGNGGSKGSARVKFVLGGEDDTVVSRNLNVTTAMINSSSNSTPVSTVKTSSSFGVDNISKSFQSQKPLFDFSPQIASNNHFPQPPNNSNINASMYSVASHSGPSQTHADIAQEMLSLMSRCNEVVISLKTSLGYVPYFSL